MINSSNVPHCIPIDVTFPHPAEYENDVIIVDCMFFNNSCA